ncbi:hypothetical protein [Halorubrum sp. 48-1-W]|nr:hypothetical protein [Halorubrum sp. 48-1-W]
MTNNIHIQVDDDEQFEKMKELKDKYGLTSKGLLVQGMKRVEEGEL